MRDIRVSDIIIDTNFKQFYEKKLNDLLLEGWVVDREFIVNDILYIISTPKKKNG